MESFGIWTGMINQNTDFDTFCKYCNEGQSISSMIFFVLGTRSDVPLMWNDLCQSVSACLFPECQGAVLLFLFWQYMVLPWFIVLIFHIWQIIMCLQHQTFLFPLAVLVSCNLMQWDHEHHATHIYHLEGRQGLFMGLSFSIIFVLSWRMPIWFSCQNTGMSCYFASPPIGNGSS